MVSFLQSSAALATATTLLSSLATSDAYARFYMSPSRPSSALGYSSGGRQRSLFSNDMRRVMNDMDSMMDSMLDEMMVDPYSLTRSRMRSRPLSYLLQGSTPSSRRELACTSRPSLKQQNNNAAPRYGITQDDKQIQLALEVPAGATANDINLSLEENDSVLKVSGKTTQEEEGISIQSSFNRSFTLGRNVDTDNISASLDNGVLKINAPKKLEEVKETVRHIDIVENKAIESGEETAVKEEEKEEVPQGESVDEVVPQEKVETTASADESIKVVDESVIDLDENKE